MIDHVLAGQDLEIPARAWNTLADMANHWVGSRGLGSNTTLPVNPCGIKCRNDSDTDLTFGKVLELSEYVLRDKPDPQHVWLAGEKPDLSKGRVPVILQQPAKQGYWAEAQISGVCLASVKVTAVRHRFALVQDGETDLQSAAAGPIRLLVPPHKAETLLLPVVLQPTDSMAFGTVGDLIPFLEYGTVQLFSGLQDTVGPTVENCFNASRDIPSGEPVKVQWVNGVPFIFPIYDQVTVVCKPQSNIPKGNIGTCEVFQQGSTTGSTIRAVALGANVRAGKWCLAFQEVASGVWYVGPWECA